MTTLINLPIGPATIDEGELYYAIDPTGGGNVRRVFSSFWRNVLGIGPTALRGFYGATPIARPAGAGQAAVATTVGAAVVTTAATTTTPYGYATQAQADDLVARVNQLRADVLAQNVLLLKIRTDLVALGLLKGSA